ncbi:type 2 lanthipeptide synthetase LanM family protein [Rhodococcus sp. NPDC003318]|uniref:type 2 lanthipeptide synthetase LanM family protein n=1 Tax=Rhodococcus sp. NPDC003318 TaxID=3364503 RepID=UPI0036780E26
MDRADLGSIVWASRSLTERLAVTSRTVSGFRDAPRDMAARRFQRYFELAGRGSSEVLQRRLSWDGLDTDTLRDLLADSPPPDDPELPSWTGTLESVVDASRGPFAETEAAGRYAFEDVWRPAAELARERLVARVGEAVPVDDLVDALLAYLCEISAPTLDREFTERRPVGLRLLAKLLPDSAAQPPRTRYHRFVQDLVADGLLSLFRSYPVLARLVATTIDDWVDTQTEFLSRLGCDLPALYGRLVEPGASVTGFDASMSDRHHGGRSVVIVRFSDGSKVVYKPRDLRIEVAFNRLVEWANRETRDEFGLRVLDVVARAGYGWVEYAPHAPADSPAAVRRYYRRSGRLLCLLYVLGATDCHDGNLIASGDQPVLVDLEALVDHQLGWLDVPDEERAVLSADVDHLWDSVLRTGMLPTWTLGRDKNHAVDISALGCPDDASAERTRPGWRFRNTDYMIDCRVAGAPDVERNVLFHDGAMVSPHDHVDSIVDGFVEMYRVVERNRSRLLGVHGAIAALDGLPVRFIFRDTQTYGLLIEHSLDPRFLRDGLDRSIELEFLGRALVHSVDRPAEWPIVAAEIAALERLDVPHFQTTTCSTDLPVGSGVVERLFAEPGFERTRNRIARMHSADCELQTQMIRGSFFAKLANNDTKSLAVSSVSAMPTRSGGDFVEHAHHIARELDTRAIELGGDGLSWMNLEYQVQNQRFAYQPVNASLYEGVCGIALFLAGYGLVADDARARSIAARSLYAFRRMLRAHRRGNRDRLPAALGLGGGVGLGSVVYAMTTIGQLLRDDLLIEDALALSELLTPDFVHKDADLDALSGSAGAILGFLKLHQATGDADALDKATWCGDHLLDSRTRIDDRVSAWKTPADEVPLGGMAHGTTGITMALARLHGVVGKPEYLAAATEGLAYESGLFDPALGSWRDLRDSAHESVAKTADGWCNGAAGYGLSRLSILRTSPQAVDVRDIETAVHAVAGRPLVALDSLCCGNFGRADFLLAAATGLRRPDLADDARELASSALQRAQDAGGYEFIPTVPKSVFSPGFFRGSAGTGYALLRLARPDLLPSVLIWD